MPLILGLILLKIAVVFFCNPPLENSVDNSPLLSLTTLKKHYNADLFYRVHTLELEHLGDLNGGRRRLNTYDPQDLKSWFKTIDVLTPTPDLLPFLVTFYYGSAPNLKPLCVDFLEDHCDHNPQRKWRWLAHGVSLSQIPKTTHRLAQKLSNYGKKYSLPLWAKDAEARHLQKQGDIHGARELFQAILNDPNNHLSPEERLFLQEISELKP